MYPTLQRGDAVFIRQAGEEQEIRAGDVIIFKSESGRLASEGWIMHRVVSGNADDGYITKGDGNERTDQDDGGAPPIQREWIASKAVALGAVPLKLPLVGYLPLWMEGLQTHPLMLPGVAVVLAVVVGVSELTGRKKRKKKSRLEQQILYFLSGLTLAVMLGTSMLATSQHLSLPYEVSSTSGVMMGSAVGILQQGEVVEKPLSDLSNSGFFPVIASVSTNDPQISFAQNLFYLRPGAEAEIKMTVTAREPGEHKASVWVGMFLPLLPAGLIHWLAQKSYWLALTAVSLVPALPLILFPVCEPRLRRLTQMEIRRAFRRMGRYIPF